MHKFSEYSNSLLGFGSNSGKKGRSGYTVHGVKLSKDQKTTSAKAVRDKRVTLRITNNALEGPICLCLLIHRSSE